MGPVDAEIQVDVPRAEAFEAIADLSRRPSFTGSFMTDFHLTRIESAGVGAGARFRFDVPLRGMWMDGAIVELDPPCRIVERGCGGRDNRIESTILWELEQGPGGLTTIQVRHRLESSNPADAALDALTGASLWYGRAWQRALRRLRDQLESGGVPQARAAIAGGGAHMSAIP